MNPTSRTFQRLAALTVAAAALMSGCATPPPQPPPPAPVVAPAPEPVAPAAPELPPAQAKPEAQKLAMQAVDSLQNGDETNARATLEKAVTLDPSNELARKLLDQIKADAQAELGSTFFRYTVQRDDSLSKLAQTYLGDRFRFYILAKYNEISNPSRLSAGQVLKIPGKGPIAPPVLARPAPAPGKPPETVEAAPKPVPEPEAPAAKDTALLQKGNALQKSGDLAGAYATYNEAVRADPANRDAIKQRDVTRTALIRQYDREAAQAYQRQNLDLAIKKWDQILELDPANQKAKLERERAIDLKKRMSEKFGTK
jgi:tetratricopeptide (TPR) repeat protein